MRSFFSRWHLPGAGVRRRLCQRRWAGLRRATGLCPSGSQRLALPNGLMLQPGRHPSLPLPSSERPLPLRQLPAVQRLPHQRLRQLPGLGRQWQHSDQLWQPPGQPEGPRIQPLRHPSLSPAGGRGQKGREKEPLQEPWQTGERECSQPGEEVSPKSLLPLSTWAAFHSSPIFHL